MEACITHLQQRVLSIGLAVTHAVQHSTGVYADEARLLFSTSTIPKLAVGHRAALGVASRKLPPQPGLELVTRQLSHAQLAFILYHHLVQPADSAINHASSA